MNKIFVLCLSLLLSFSSHASGSRGPTPPTVDEVNLSSYLGNWFELERIPNSFQDNKPSGYSECYNTVASYAQRSDAKIDVQNSCIRSKEGAAEKAEIARAIAKVVSGSNNSRLKVNFTGIALLRWLGIGDGNYWILGLGPIDTQSNQYRWAIVGSPKLDFGWVLSRSTSLTPSEWKEIGSIRRDAGYNLASFIKSRRN